MIESMTDLPALRAFLSRIGAEPRSLRIAVVKENHGNYWKDLAIIRVNKDGRIDAPQDYMPTESEAAMITTEVTTAEWPTSIKLGKSYELPEELKTVDPDDIYELKDRSGKLIMLQVRTQDVKSGEKRYVPFTFWSDQRWRKAEPEGQLPIYGLDTIKDNTTVFLHEGCKAAKFVRKLIDPRTEEERAAYDSHPWGLELSGAAHLGWIGGALSPSRTDWSELAKMGIQRAYIVADNDKPGKTAIPKIAQRLKNITTFSVEFTEVFPASFDLADPFPKKFFKKQKSADGKTALKDGVVTYQGPSFREVLHPATWATDLEPNPSGSGKPVVVLRGEFADLWVWIEEVDSFICKEMPEINHSLALFNATVAGFSHIASTGQLIQKNYKGRIAKICYRPDIKARIVTDRTTSAINLHTPTNIKPGSGDVGPWIKYLDYMFPVERERTEVKRWVATLIARPEIRMLYGMLLISEKQGIGKTTMGAHILAPLVGYQNTGFPGERDIVESTFNGWIANKRLIVVNEIYTGQSFKAYNLLKGYLTDKNIHVNEKFQRPYTIENWAHILACSNSKKALRVEESDRRWFYPQVSEVPWNKDEWTDFYDWLDAGGLNIIMRWALDFGDYVATGAHAPMTLSKKAMIEESKGDVLNHWIDVMEAIEEGEEAVSFSLNEVRETYRKRAPGRLFETLLDFKREAIQRKWKVSEERILVGGALTLVVSSPVQVTQLAKFDGNEEPKKDKVDRLRKTVTNLYDRLHAI